MNQMNWRKLIDALLVQAKELEDSPTVSGMTTHGLLVRLADALAAGIGDIPIIYDEKDLDRMRNAMRRPMTEI